MRKTFLFIAILLLMAGMPANAQAATLQSENPVVHTVLFWSNGCQFCAQVLTETLPPVQEKYDAQLSILLVELATTQDVEKLFSLGSNLGLSKEQVAVPFLLIDHTALVGVKEIRDRFPGLIDKHLSEGGLDYPDLPQLSEMLSSGIAFTSFKPNEMLIAQAETGSKDLGTALAWAVMAFMGFVLALSVVMIVRAFNGKPLGKANQWLDFAVPVLTVIGLGVSLYLSYVEVTNTRAICGPVGDCNTVQSSPYAKLFGILPIGIAGTIGYIAILITWLWKYYRSDALARIGGPVIFGMALFGTLFSIYLTYLELFIIHAVCLWCLSSAVIISALMLLNLPPLTQWLAISDEDE